jgi:potassium/hydrogen antiporter
MAIALTIGLIDWIEKPNYGITDLALLLVRQLGLGLVIGVALGVMATWAFARLPQSVGVFAPVASVAAGALSFGVADVSGGSGFLAVYLVGLAVGSTPSRFRRQLVAFHEGLAFIAQVVMFVVLGLLVFPHELGSVALSGLALAALLALLIRPIAVWISTVRSRFTTRERALLGWAGLRGAVPIVLGTIVLSENVQHGKTIFNAVFFVVVVSALVQGTTLERVAETLRVISLAPKTVVPPLEVGHLSSLDLIDFDVAPDHAIAGAAVPRARLAKNSADSCGRTGR